MKHFGKYRRLEALLVTPWMAPSTGPSKAKPEGARTGGPRSRRQAKDGLSAGLRSEGSAQGTAVGGAIIGASSFGHFPCSSKESATPAGAGTRNKSSRLQAARSRIGFWFPPESRKGIYGLCAAITAARRNHRLRRAVRTRFATPDSCGRGRKRRWY